MQTTATDIRLLRVEKQLGSVIVVLRHATREAEAFSDQTLADILTEHLIGLERIHTQLLTGKRPRAAALTHVRN